MNAKILLSGLILFSTISFLSAQEITDHEFAGKIYIDGKKAKDVLVKAYDGNKCFSNYMTGSNGKFVFTGGVEKYYTLEFKKEGYVTKRIVIRTHNTRNLEFETSTYRFDVDLVKEEEGVDYDEYDFPITIIEIDSNEEEFTHNRKYTENRLKAISLKADNQMASR